jgi:hypothetical protein
LQLKAELDEESENKECNQATTSPLIMYWWPQMLDIADLAIHPVVCQKSDFHRYI